jgi:hypothetical protein
LLTADLATGLSTALTKDGQTTPTANIPMGSFKITSLGAGTAATDAAQYGQLQAGATTIATVTGTDTYVGTLTPAIAAYATGNLFSFVAPNTNTGAATINLNSLGAKNITKLGSTALAAGDIVSGRVYQIEYDGTRFQLLNPSASSVASFSAGSTGFTPSSATTGAVTLAGTLATTNGGTGLTSFTANGVVYASSSSALATGSALQFDGQYVSIGTGASSPNGIKFLANGGGLAGSLTFNHSTGEIQNFASTNYFPTWYANNAERMRLDASGNLGIGTSSPTEKLHVAGALRVTGAQTTAGTGVYLDQTSGTGGVSVYGPDNSTQGTFRVYTATANGGTGSTKLTLDSSGNLGLGVTPSAWGSGTENALQVKYASIYGYSNYETGYSVNAYYNASWKYIASTSASQYKQSNGTHAWYNAPSGTAGNAITFTQAMTLDASGNLGVGITSPNVSGQSASVKVVSISGSGNNWAGIELNNPSSSGGSLLGFIGWTGSNMTSSYNMPAYIGTWLASGTSLKQGGELRFHTQSDNTAGATERARIDSFGNLLVGTTSENGIGITLNSNNYIYVATTSSTSAYFDRRTSAGTLVEFRYSGSPVGSISTNGTLTAYNVSSDQRLKENIVDAPEFGSVIDSLQVRSFDWKSDQSHQRAGFIAQELVTVAPEAVSQPSDAEEMMGVDYSKLVPMLVKEIQSLRKRLADAGI